MYKYINEEPLDKPNILSIIVRLFEWMHSYILKCHGLCTAGEKHVVLSCNSTKDN